MSVNLRCSLVFAIFACLGCGGPLPEIRSDKPRDVETDAWNGMHTTAASDLGCGLSELRATRLDSREEGGLSRQSFEIAGCGKKAFYHLVSNGLGYVLVSDRNLRDKLKFSYGESCPNFEVRFIDGLTRGVDACGQKIVYVYNQAAGWVANTVTTSDGKTR